MITPRVTITGDKELDRILKDLGQNALKDSQVKQGLRKLAKPIIKTMKDEAKAEKKGTKQLSKSIGVIRRVKSKKGKPFILVGPRYYFAALKHPVDIVEFGSEKYDVEYEGKKFVEKTFNTHKTKLTSDLRKLILELLNKKLKKLR
jgi:HK97 gp10 family phage protein